jgi:hypothetical protein
VHDHGRWLVKGLGLAVFTAIALSAALLETPEETSDTRRAASTDEAAPDASSPPGQRVKNRRRRRNRPPSLPEGRAVGELGQRACERILEGHGVPFERVERGDAEGVEMPIRLTGKIGDVEIVHRDHGRRRRRARIRRLEILDCRLAVALLAWAPTLRAANVERVDHYSAYRPGARVSSTGRPSGHASGLAIDVGDLRLANGMRVHVEEHWADKRRGVSPCPARDEDGAEQRLLREVVCAAATADIFQVVLTPHHDEHHANHVHLELRPGVTWSLLE